jgi:hypothetical protein
MESDKVKGMGWVMLGFMLGFIAMTVILAYISPAY